MSHVTLYAPQEYWKMPSESLYHIAQGCGPGRIGDKLVPDKLLGLSISQACQIHDYMYHVGESEADRCEADRVFLNNMLRLIDARTDSWWITTVIRRRMALHYYRKCANYGGFFYWNDKNPKAVFKAVETS